MNPDQGLAIRGPVRRCCEDPGAIHCNPLRGPCMILHRSFQEDLVRILMKSLRGPCTILYVSLRGDLVEILIKSCLSDSCMEILKTTCIRGACVEALVGCSYRILCGALMGPYRMFLRRSLVRSSL